MNRLQKPLVSIITVTYNNAALLEKTVNSVISQTYRSEYIVVDGGSTDGSIDIISKNEASISKWISEKDTGIYNAMNKGAKLASGEWICFLNSGDVFVDEHSLEKVFTAIESFNNASDIVYGNILVRKGENGFYERVASAPTNKHRMYFCHQIAFVKRDLLLAHPFDEKHKMSADFKFFKECYYNKYKFTHLNFPIVIYDTTGISNARREDGLRDNISVIKELDKGLTKLKFLARLYFTIYWRKVNNKK